MKIHIDIDCFFVSAHRSIDETLNNIPLAVGSRSNLSIFEETTQIRHISRVRGAFTSSILSSNGDKTFQEYYKDSDGRVRGIITTASYEARDYGVKTAMSVAESLRLCPKLRVLPPDYPLYHKISNDIKEFLESEIPLIEQFSIDEFFCDITGWIKDEDAYMFALYLQEEILKRFKIPVSIGLSRSKWIAKLATEDAKPQGIKLVEEDEINEYISNIPIGDFPGVGKGFLQRLSGHGIKTMGDVRGKEKLFLRWGKNGEQLYKRILGIDEEPIVLAKEKKSIGLGRTFDPIMDREEIKRRIVILSRHISFIALKDEHKPMSYFLKIRYRYGEKSKDHISSNRLFSEKLCKELMLELFDTIDTHPSREIIQLNLTLSNFLETKYTTLNILHYDIDTKSNALSHALHSLRNKFGIDIIKNAREMK